MGFIINKLKIELQISMVEIEKKVTLALSKSLATTNRYKSSLTI